MPSRGDGLNIGPVNMNDEEKEKSLKNVAKIFDDFRDELLEELSDIFDSLQEKRRKKSEDE